MVTIRKVPLITGNIYHIFNRGIDGRATFTDGREYKRFLYAMNYYSYSDPPMSLSRYLQLTEKGKYKLNNASWGKKIIILFCYCLMPNHFHFLLKQNFDLGIPRFISQVLNSYTRYFNTKNKRIGQLFLDQYKNVLIENDNQFIHVSRYIHLNPFSSGMLNNKKALIGYEWSSLGEYLEEKNIRICDKSIIKSFFKRRESYKRFIFDNADYQKKLKLIRNLIVE